MIDKIKAICRKQEELMRLVSGDGPDQDPARMQEYLKEISKITPIADAYREWEAAGREIEEAKQMLSEETDPEMRSLLEEEIKEASERLEGKKEEMMTLMIPEDPDDVRNAVVEIRAGAGGDEAALFAADLAKMYYRYSELHGFRVETVSVSENGLGGFKECVFIVNGRNVFSRLKYESGTHRVQRIPVTESGGRIHTSTATVAILPEAEDVEVELDPKDYKFDVFRASGNGGQCVNTTDSAVRLTHFPTGIVISCQDEKSQIKNKAKALKVLKARLLELGKSRAASERAAVRRDQVGSGDRSEKIRTYNFPQGRVTDHRIHFTTHRIDSVMAGELDEIVDALIRDENARALAAMKDE